MRQSRDELINLKIWRGRKQIVLDQSKFEPPATIKKTKSILDKNEHTIKPWKLQIKKSEHEKMNRWERNLGKYRTRWMAWWKLMQMFNVIAPEDGMVIYEKGLGQRAIKAGFAKFKCGNQPWPHLPDLTKMLSKTYVNEVDVRKNKSRQRVEVGLDAFPDKNWLAL